MRCLTVPLARTVRASLSARRYAPATNPLTPTRSLRTVTAAWASLNRRDPTRYEGAATASNSLSAGADEFPAGRRYEEAEVLAEDQDVGWEEDEDEGADHLAKQYTMWDEGEADEQSWADPGPDGHYYGSGADIGFDGPVGRSLRRLSPAARYGIEKRGVLPIMPWGMTNGIRHLRKQIPNSELRHEVDIWKRTRRVQLSNHQFSAPRDDLYTKRKRTAAAMVSYFVSESPGRYIAIHGVLSTLKKRLAAEMAESSEKSEAAGVPAALRPNPFKPTRLVEWDCAGAEGAWAFADVFDPPPKPDWASEEWPDPTVPPKDGAWTDHERRHPRVRPIQDALEYWGATGDIKRMNVAADMLAQTSSWKTMSAWRGKVSRFDTWGRSHAPPIHTHMYDRLIATLTYRPTKPSRVVVPKRLFREIRRAERQSGILDPSRPSDQQHLHDLDKNAAQGGATHKSDGFAESKRGENEKKEEEDEENEKKEEEAEEVDYEQLTAEESASLAQLEQNQAKQRRKKWANVEEEDPDETPEDRAAYEEYVKSEDGNTEPNIPKSYPDKEQLSEANQAAMQGALEGDNLTPDKDTILMSAFRLSHLKSDQDRVDYVTRMWKQKWADVFVLIEQADPRGFAAIASARALLLRLGATTHTTQDTQTQDNIREGGENLEIDGQTFYEIDAEAHKGQGEPSSVDGMKEVVGAHVVAPCPHDKPCPLLHPFSLIPEVDRINLNEDLQSTRAVCRFHNEVGLTREHRQLFSRGKFTGELSKDYTYIIVRRGPRPNVDAAQEALRQEVAAATEKKKVEAALKAAKDASSVHDAAGSEEAVPDLVEAAAQTKVGEVEWIRRQKERDLAAEQGEEEGATHILTEAQLQEAVGKLEKDEEEAVEARKVLDSMLPSVVEHLRQQNPEAYQDLSDEDVAELIAQMQGEGQAPSEPQTEQEPRSEQAEASDVEAQYIRNAWPEESAMLDDAFPDEAPEQNQGEQTERSASEAEAPTIQVDMPPSKPGRESISPPPELGPLEYGAMQVESYSWPRLLIPSSKKGGHVLLYACTDDGNIKRFLVSKRNVQAYQDARKSRKGDLFPHFPDTTSRSTMVERARADTSELATPAAMHKRTKTRARDVKAKMKSIADDYDIDRDESEGTDTTMGGLDDEEVEKLLELERLTDYAEGLDVQDELDPLAVYDPYAGPRQTSQGAFRQRQKPATLKQRQGEDPEVAAYGAIGPDAMAIVNRERLAPPTALVTPVHGDDTYLPSINAGLTQRSRKARELKRKQTLEMHAQIDPAFEMPELERAAHLHKARAGEVASGGKPRDDIPDRLNLPRDSEGKLLPTHHKVHLDFKDDDPDAGFRALERHRRRASRIRSKGDYDLGLDSIVLTPRKK